MTDEYRRRILNTSYRDGQPRFTGAQAASAIQPAFDIYLRYMQRWASHVASDNLLRVELVVAVERLYAMHDGQMVGLGRPPVHGVPRADRATTVDLSQPAGRVMAQHALWASDSISSAASTAPHNDGHHRGTS